MNLISAENISKSFDERQLFSSLSFGLERGEKVALTGANGAGKSTLMKVLVGLIQPDTGLVATQKETRVGFLPQVPHLAEGQTALEAALSGSGPKTSLYHRYQRALIDPDLSDELTDLMEQMDAWQAWDLETQAEAMLGQLGVHDMDKKVDAMSGGQKKRVAMARTLLDAPDVLMLDEPTNHLDIVSIEWLENYLSTGTLTLLMITHDRYFLDNVANVIAELHQGQVYKHPGNYASYLENKTVRLASEDAAADKARNLLKREQEWMRRQPKARGTKSKSRVEAFYDLKEQAKGRQKESSVELSVKAGRQGKKILEARSLTKHHGDKIIFEGFDYTFKKNEKIGVVGKNGSGKSTLLDVLAEVQSPTSGTVKTGINTKIGYYTQEAVSLTQSNRIIDEVKNIAEFIEIGEGQTITAGKLLERFLFPPSTQYKFIETLSGGEQRRLQLLKVLATAPNFLILDEPTNDLDMDTLNVLEDFLQAYEGCLLLVSHDRYLVDRLTDHLFILDEADTEVKQYNGNYSDYRYEVKQKDAETKAEEAAKKRNQKPADTSGKNTFDNKLNYNEKREYENLEKDIQKLENQKLKLTEQLNEPGQNYEQLQEKAQKIKQLEDDIEAKTFRWMELDERA